MTTLSEVAQTAACDATLAGLNGGSLVFLTAADAVVATLPFAATAFAGAVNGVAASNTIAPDTNVVGGTIAKAVGRTSVAADHINWTVTATGGGGDIELTSLTFAAGETLDLTGGMTHEQPA